MNKQYLFKDYHPHGDVAKDLEMLNKQIEVGKLLNANPAILEFIEIQIQMLLNTLVGVISGTAEHVKDVTLMHTHQIAVYRFMHDMATKNDELVQQYAEHLKQRGE